MIDVYTIAARSRVSTPSQIIEYEKLARRVWSWYAGKNSLGVNLYDPIIGSCADGIGEREISLNQGAESTLSAVMSLQTMRESLKLKTVDNIVSKVSKAQTKQTAGDTNVVEIN